MSVGGDTAARVAAYQSSSNGKTSTSEAMGSVEVLRKGKRRISFRVVGSLLVLVVAIVGRFSSPSSEILQLVQVGRSSSCLCGGGDGEIMGSFQGVVKDCCCDYETVDALNREALHPVLQKLVTTPFFRHYKVKLWCDCPFWPDDGVCALRDCSVCECPESEFPAALRGSDLQYVRCQEERPEGVVDRTVDAKAFRGWIDRDNPWTADDEAGSGGDPDTTTYVNLVLNPERFTGYKGESARRIWDAIYEQNCFENREKELCAERRVLWRLISGLHTSISAHIAADCIVDETTNTWGKSPALMHEKVLQHPERVQNLYFTFLFVLRALIKAETYLSEAEYATGNGDEDVATRNLVASLVASERVRTACPIPFDEAALWRGPDAVELKQQLQSQFRNISALMDCVGCEKCRLWGKLQISGLGTALKILFAVDDDKDSSAIDLQRNEVIALVNLLSKLSESLALIHEMAEMVRVQDIRVSSTLPNGSKSRRWFLHEDNHHQPLRSLPSLFHNFGF